MTTDRLPCPAAAALCAALSLSPALPARAEPAPLPPLVIADNSFFIEEAYNQEPGVVQHIFTFMRFGSPVRVSDLSFTQEWPFHSQAHQLSFTLPCSWPSDGEAGLGDLLLNYRYQVSSEEHWAAFAPRLSLVLPTSGEGSSEPGLQLNLPASKRLGARLVAHANLGATILPATEERGYNVGGSLVVVLAPRLHLLLEATSTLTSTRVAGGRTSERESILSPGLRAALDVGRLQIVPGLAVPVRRGGGRSDVGVFAYVSFEHPFRPQRP